MSSPSKRRDMDVMKLMMSDYEVAMSESGAAGDFYVKFNAPKDSLYEGGIYRIHVTLPATYPYKSPSIGFQTKIFHPNVDEASGSVCLDVINQTWSPMYDLVNIFNIFLPQLLLYPNPADPLNGSAAALMFKEPEAYKLRIQEHVRKHASVDFKLTPDDEDDEEEAAPPAAAASGAAAAAKATAAAAAEAAADEEEEEEAEAMSSEDEAAAMSDLDDAPEEEDDDA